MKEISELEEQLISTEPDEQSIWRKIAEYYFEPKKFERWRDGRIYELIGVKHFKNFVTKSMEKYSGNKFQDNYFIQNYSTKGLHDFLNQTVNNELYHLIAIIPTLMFIPGWIEREPLSLWLGIPVSLLNFYTILIQRYNRSRIYNALDRIDSK